LETKRSMIDVGQICLKQRDMSDTT
jgi:hypothetical protein